MANDVVPAEDVEMLIVVAAALVDTQGRVLLQRRPPGASLAGLWEFPGGKMEPGETPEAALARELREELAIEVAPEAMVATAFSSVALAGRHLLLLLYRIDRWAGAPRALAADALDWVRPSAMGSIAMPAADYPLAAQLAQAAGAVALSVDPGVSKI